MRAVVLERPCAAEELELKEIPVPKAVPGWVLVKIKAFGLNRSELFTRRGLSPSVKLPRIIGIECAGEVADPSDSGLPKGQRIVSLMGGLGRQFDGSYAEYALIPSAQTYTVDSTLEWSRLAAIPETYFTAYGSLFGSLRIKSGETLLIRGGTSSVGLAALQLAKSAGLTVFSTTRSKRKSEILSGFGADAVLIDDGTLNEQLFSALPKGADKVLELIGTLTLKESLALLKSGGVLCVTGILGDEWTVEHFDPIEDIPSGVCLTSFQSGGVNSDKLNKMFSFIKNHNIETLTPQVFSLEEIGKAHRLMEDNGANGKIVIVN